MKVCCAHDKLVPVSELTPNPRNPNKHPKEQIELLARIIKETGWRSPVVVSTLSGYVVKGHGRLAAAVHAGFETVPVDYQDYETAAQETADLVADNQIAEFSEADVNIISDLLGDIDSAGYDIDLLGLPDGKEILEATRKTFTQKDAEKINVTGEDLGDSEFFLAMNKPVEPELPIIPLFSEHHQAFIIICDNRIDEAFIREKLGLDKPRKSYADVKRVIPNIINASEVIEKWK